MFVKTQSETIVNIANFDKITIEWDVKNPNSEDVYHILSAVSGERSETLAISNANVGKEFILSRYDNLLRAIADGRSFYEINPKLSAGPATLKDGTP